MSGLIYLTAAVLFILAIRGLSSPRSARLGNGLGIAGMTLAVVTALALVPPQRLLLIVPALTIGGHQRTKGQDDGAAANDCRF